MKTPEERKAESMAFLKSMGVTVNCDLPSLEPESEIRLRSAVDVAQRVICLVFVADFAQGNADRSYWEYIKKHSMRPWFTTQEWKFLKSWLPDKQTKINMSWRTESAFFLLWAMGRLPDLPFPTNPINADDVYRCLPPFDEPPSSFLDTAALISRSAILDKADLIYRIHWAARHASSDEDRSLQEGLIREWHHAVNWLTFYGDESWDEVSTDT